MQDYKTTRTFDGAFSFLPELTQDEIYDQVVYLINQGWAPSIEHDSAQYLTATYWDMWKLPFFGLRDPDVVMAEIEECRRAYPDHFIRIVGYDNYQQCKGFEQVVYKPRG